MRPAPGPVAGPGTDLPAQPASHTGSFHPLPPPQPPQPQEPPQPSTPRHADALTPPATRTSPYPRPHNRTRTPRARPRRDLPGAPRSRSHLSIRRTCRSGSAASAGPSPESGGPDAARRPDLLRGGHLGPAPSSDSQPRTRPLSRPLRLGRPLPARHPAPCRSGSTHRGPPSSVTRRRSPRRRPSPSSRSPRLTAPGPVRPGRLTRAPPRRVLIRDAELVRGPRRPRVRGPGLRRAVDIHPQRQVQRPVAELLATSG